MRDEGDRHADPMRHQVQRDAVRIAVARHDREPRMAARKELEVSPVVREELQHPECGKHAVAPAHAPGQPRCPPAVSNDRRRQPRKRRRHGHEPPPEDDLGPPAARQHPPQLRDGAAFVRPPRRHDGVAVARGGDARVAPERVQEHEPDRKGRRLRPAQRPAEQTDPAALGQDELQDPLHHLAAVAGQKRSHAGEQGGVRGRGDSHHRTRVCERGGNGLTVRNC